MSKHPQTQLTDLDLAVARALYDQVELRWCHLCDDDNQWYEWQKFYNPAMCYPRDWMQEWCYLDGCHWETVPAYSIHDHSAFDALHQFCNKHGYYIRYETYFKRAYDGSDQVWHLVEITPEIAEYKALSFALAAAECILDAVEYMMQDDDYSWCEHPPDPDELA